jgi:hypothetical protein
MKTYTVEVTRHQKWTFEVEAENPEDAKNQAVNLAIETPAHDDYSVTIAEIVSETGGEA